MNIYVGNLSYGVSDDNLREVFKAFGAVSSAKVITDKYSGRSKGFGFIRFADAAVAKTVLNKQIFGFADIFVKNLNICFGAQSIVHFTAQTQVPQNILLDNFFQSQ